MLIIALAAAFYKTQLQHFHFLKRSFSTLPKAKLSVLADSDTKPEPGSLLDLIAGDVGVCLVIQLPAPLEFSGRLDHAGIHVLSPVNDFFVTTMNHWPCLRIAKVAASPLNHVTGCGIGVAALWTLKAARRGLELAFKAALEALID